MSRNRVVNALFAVGLLAAAFGTGMVYQGLSQNLHDQGLRWELRSKQDALKASQDDEKYYRERLEEVCGSEPVPESCH